MKIYLVGGAVRDQLLDLPVRDRDWVVVGGSGEQLLARGLQAADAEFPVFIDPASGEEYALARREIKTGPGYKGFHIEAGHWQKSDVLDRVARHLDAARMAHHIRNLRAGLVGEPFEGMGDFYVPTADLKATIGVDTHHLNPRTFKALAAEVPEQEI